jgi:hypothetical protein
MTQTVTTSRTRLTTRTTTPILTNRNTQTTSRISNQLNTNGFQSSDSPVTVQHTDTRGRRGQYVDQTSPFMKKSNGSVSFSTKGLQVDTDGAKSSNGSASHQGQTSLFTKDAKGKVTYADSSKIPYVAIPPAALKGTGAKMGDLVRVTAPNGKQAWAIIADTNDNRAGRKLGEGSLALHKQLGYSGSTGSASTLGGEVKYELYPGSGSKTGVVNPGGIGKMPTTEEIQAAGRKLAGN